MELLCLYLFPTFANVVDSLNFWVNATLFFHAWIATYVFQFSSETVPLNFVWLSHNAPSSFINYKPPCFLFVSYINLVLCGLPHLFTSHLFASLTEWNCPTFLYVNVTKYSCVSITSKWTLHFVFFSVITDLFSFFSCVDSRTSFFKWKLICLTSFLLVLVIKRI